MASTHTFLMSRAQMGVLLALCLAGPMRLASQEPHRVSRTPAEMLEAMKHQYATNGVLPPPTGGTGDLTHVLTYPKTYPRAQLDQLLDGLEQLALTSTNDRLKGTAAFMISSPCSVVSPDPISGCFARLARVYRRSDDPSVKRMIIAGMGHLIERPEAIAFLEDIAVQPASQAAPGTVQDALIALSALGAEGQAVLQRLDQTGAVKDPDARYMLSRMALRGYRPN